MKERKGNMLTTKDNRFRGKKSDTPGPGAYEVTMATHDKFWKYSEFPVMKWTCDRSSCTAHVFHKILSLCMRKPTIWVSYQV